jgi:hypothetical protein
LRGLFFGVGGFDRGDEFRSQRPGILAAALDGILSGAVDAKEEVLAEF